MFYVQISLVSSLLSDFLHSLLLIPTFISCSPIACERGISVLPTQPDDKGAECEGDGPSVLSSTRQANRRQSKIRIMRGALAWANWNDTHSHRWSCTHFRTRTLLRSFKSMPIYLFVCLSVWISPCSFICILSPWHDDFNLELAFFLFFLLSLIGVLLAEMSAFFQLLKKNPQQLFL